MVYCGVNDWGMFWYVDCGIMRCRQERRFLTSFVIPRIFVKENSRGIQKNKTPRNSANPAFRFFTTKSRRTQRITKNFLTQRTQSHAKFFALFIRHTSEGWYPSFLTTELNRVHRVFSSLIILLFNSSYSF